MLKYLQRTGQLFHLVQGTSSHWELFGTGYAGIGEGLNAPEKENVSSVGPCPSGLWAVSFSFTHPTKGPLCFRLVPLTYAGTRSGFLIHGDNSTPAVDDASNGCIVMDHVTRDKIRTSKCQYLLVESGD